MAGMSKLSASGKDLQDEMMGIQNVLSKRKAVLGPDEAFETNMMNCICAKIKAMSSLHASDASLLMSTLHTMPISPQLKIAVQTALDNKLMDSTQARVTETRRPQLLVTPNNCLTKNDRTAMSLSLIHI